MAVLPGDLGGTQKGTTDTVATIPSNMDRLALGNNRNLSLPLGNYLRRTATIARAYSNAELQSAWT